MTIVHPSYYSTPPSQLQPPTPANERLCLLCDSGSVESEKHFLIECPLYSDLRYDLFLESTLFIENFDTLDVNGKFLGIINCSDIQNVLCKVLHKFYVRRKRFLF